MLPMTFLDRFTLSSASLPMLLLLAKATVILIAALGATIVMQRASAGSRHLVWLVSLAALVLLPALVAWSPLRLAVLPETFVSGAGTPTTQPRDLARNSGPNEQPSNSIVRQQNDGASAARLANPPQPSAAVGNSAAWPLSAGRTLLAVWAAIAAIFAGWLTFGALSVRRIVRRATLLDEPAWRTPLFEIADRLGLGDAPRLLRSEDVKMPFACGVMQPTIVLPSDADSWTLDRRRAVLLHELSHVRRRDLVGHTLGRLVCAVYWFHPLVWTAARRLRAESERACDDIALACGARASDYAEHLLDIVTCVRNHATPSVALAMAHRKEFEGRMLAILDPGIQRQGPSRRQSVALIGGLAALALVVGAAAPVVRTAAARPVDRGTVGRDADPKYNPSVRADTQVAITVNTIEARRMSTEYRRSATTANPVPAAKPAPVPQPRASRSPLVDSIVDAARRNSSVAQSGQQRADDRPALLAGVLRSDTSASLRKVAAWGLAQYGESDIAIDALVLAVRRDASPAVREMAAWALGETGEHRQGKVAEALSAALRQDTDSKVRVTAAWALGEIGDDSAADALTQALSADDAAIRVRAAWALGELGLDRAPKPLVAMLSDKDARVRKITAWALHNMRDPESAAALDAALGRETDRDVQQALIKALASVGERSVDAIRRLLDSKDPEIRALAIKSLAGQGAGPWPWPWPDPRPNP
jgi:beta-lactamase regulating signal transducer with metallopeptidase domain/HEAT repeat protein